MSGLKRQFGLFGAVVCVLGIIIGAGIYVIIGKAAGLTGNSLWLSFLIAAVIAACTGLSYAELSSTFPYDSAEYVYSEKAFKDRRFSFGISWLKMASLVIGTSAVSLGFGGYLSRLTGINFVVCALLLLAFVAAMNFVGLKQALFIDFILIGIAVIGLVFVIVAGAGHLGSVNYFDFQFGWDGVVSAAALIFFAYLGFENLGSLGEEVRNPKRNLPLALIISLAISTVLYILVALVVVSVLPWQQLAQSNAPLADVMQELIGTKTAILLSIMALGATGSTVLGLAIGGSRMLYGLAEEKQIPAVFLKVTKKGVPYVAVLAVTVLCAVFVIPGDIRTVAELTDFSALFIFIVVNACLITLRYTHHHIPRTFRVPVNIGKFPIIPAIGLLSSMYLLFSYSKKVFLAGIVMFLFGMLLYSVFWERKHVKHVSEKVKRHMKS